MSGKMQRIPFDKLVTWILAEYRQEHTIFGVVPKPALDPGRQPEYPIGPAAGPQTQLAQNIIAAYAAGGRYFELKTVQVLDGNDLKVEKPCIAVTDAGYNVEWSTELSVPEAFAEYVKAWFALNMLALEFSLGSPQGFVFNMSIGYDLQGIKSEKINTFIDGLMDASPTAIWLSCQQYLQDHVALFKKIRLAEIGRISPRICSSVTLSTLHGCPPQEIERIAGYLLTEKKLDTFVKCNPTMLGFQFVRSVLNQQGFKEIAFDEHHFREDLQPDDAISLIRRLQKVAVSAERRFGVKLTNTLPVQISHNELPGREMYLSGPALYPLAINLACRLAEAFDGRIRISFCGGADYFNCAKILRTGIFPVTLATSLLKPGGYARLTQLAESLDLEKPAADGTVLDLALLRQLAAAARDDPEYRNKKLPPSRRKLNRKVPLVDCFTAPCISGCPFGQDVPDYIQLMGEERFLDALLTITAKNPLPFMTGMFCDHPCMGKCTRNDCDEAVNIRGVKLLAAREALDELVSCQAAPAFNQTVKAACLGGTPAGLAAAWFLCQNGIETTVFEKKEALGNLGKPVSPALKKAVDQDIRLLQKGGVRFETDVDPSEFGFKYIFNAREYLVRNASIAEGIAEGMRFADTVIRQETGKPLSFRPPVAIDLTRQLTAAMAKKGRLLKPDPPEKEYLRCLSCNLLCNICCEVCPNRANIMIRVPTKTVNCQNQVIHLDGPCNECGNCATFCPYDSAPYQEKFTLFWREADFQDSQNDGFVRLDQDKCRYRIRLGGKIHELQHHGADNFRAEGLPESILDLIKTTIKDYDYLMLENS